MKYNQPFDQPASPDASFVDGNPATGTPGSIPPAASIEYPQREIVNLITDAGIVAPSNSDLHQLGRSIQSGALFVGEEQPSSTANAYVVNLSPVPSEYYDGMVIWFRTAYSNTVPLCTLNAGAGTRNIVRRGNGALQPGDIRNNTNTLLSFNASTNNFELYSAIGGGTADDNPIITVLTANANLYVNASTGSDTLYDGSSATVVAGTKHGPFRTIQKAVNYAFTTWLPSLFTVLVHVAAGTYNESVQSPSYSGPNMDIGGAGVGLTIVASATRNYSTFMVTGPNHFVIHDLTFSNAVSYDSGQTPSGIAAFSGASISSYNTACTGDFAAGAPFLNVNSTMFVGSHTFYGTATYADGMFWSCWGGNLWLANDAIFTTSGQLTFTTGAATCQGSSLCVPNPHRPSFTGGTFVGARYNVFANGIIASQGAGSTYFPGNASGTSSTGGQYV